VLYDARRPRFVQVSVRIVMFAGFFKTASFSAILLAGFATPAPADSVPTLKIGPSCEAAGRGSVVLGRSKEACMADENAARDSLKKNWSKYSGTDKQQCIGMEKTGGPSSYVELLSCLEVRHDARNIKNADPLESDTSPLSTRRNRR
jgi:hypothetical protein